MDSRCFYNNFHFLLKSFRPAWEISHLKRWIILKVVSSEGRGNVLFPKTRVQVVVTWGYY